MWSIIPCSRHLPLYAAGQLDCVDGAAMQRVGLNGKRWLQGAHWMLDWTAHVRHIIELQPPVVVLWVHVPPRNPTTQDKSRNKPHVHTDWHVSADRISARCWSSTQHRIFQILKIVGPVPSLSDAGRELYFSKGEPFQTSLCEHWIKGAWLLVPGGGMGSEACSHPENFVIYGPQKKRAIFLHSRPGFWEGSSFLHN